MQIIALRSVLNIQNSGTVALTEDYSNILCAVITGAREAKRKLYTDCVSKLIHHYNLVQGKWIEDSFICSGYRHLIHDCTMNHIPTAKIEAANPGSGVDLRRPHVRVCCLEHDLYILPKNAASFL